ncbi:MAG: adenylate/guanylate cyclase domain-containing protein [Elusimicrobiota bacterium]|nr:adenylate/guanylate cyclase domain-containing protein [Elusimicrobiota bacterium]
MIAAAEILSARILIVDDKKSNIQLLQRMLLSAGYICVKATMDPSEVKALHRAHRYDLILLDLQMPGMDGFAVMEDLKELETDGYLPVLVLTAQPDHKLRALNAGARDFVSKPFDLTEVLLRVHNLLEVRLLHLKTKALYEQVVVEQKMSERLLRNVLPYSIAVRLKGRPEVAGDGFTDIIADGFPEVTVLFADIVGFTKFSQSVGAEVLVGVLNDLFSRFDRIADRRGLEKIKTIGDCYMAAAGLPIPAADHAARAADAALDMLDAVAAFNAGGRGLNIRIGLDTGPVVAGVIGRSKFLYDLWGDAVNTASRMESNGVPGRVQMTEATRGRLTEPFSCEKRGLIDVKGKGPMTTWFLNGRTAMAVPAL